MPLKPSSLLLALLPPSGGMRCSLERLVDYLAGVRDAALPRALAGLDSSATGRGCSA